MRQRQMELPMSVANSQQLSRQQQMAHAYQDQSQMMPYQLAQQNFIDNRLQAAG